MNNLSVGVSSIFSDVNCLSKLLTSLRCLILGLNGGWTSRFSILSQSIRLKKEWPRTSSSPRDPQPKRFDGFLVRNWKNFGYTAKLAPIKIPLCRSPWLPSINPSGSSRCGLLLPRTVLLHLPHRMEVARPTSRIKGLRMPTNQPIYRTVDTELSPARCNPEFRKRFS
uniref:Uncharacterized protein n=1 Tax=Photinus pyralis TaxID=7054 RepID=A0A1Y1KUG9_PHOPY